MYNMHECIHAVLGLDQKSIHPVFRQTLATSPPRARASWLSHRERNRTLLLTREHEDVGGLDVPVDDALVVQELNRRQHLPHAERRLLLV